METLTDLHDDWEILQEPNPVSDQTLQENPDDGGAIKSDYFSLNPTTEPDDYNNESADSDNPSWVEPRLDPGVGFWSDTSSENSVAETEAKPEPEPKPEPTLEGERSGWMENGSGDSGDGRAPWWKLPLGILKVYLFRFRPMWSIPIAAAILGVVVLGRKIYRMRLSKSRSIPLRILAVDDKKASQFKAQAARLNDAFSVAKHIPVIRPLPAGGVTPWPMVALR